MEPYPSMPIPPPPPAGNPNSHHLPYSPITRSSPFSSVLHHSPHPPAPTSRYDVFISFYGDDVRGKFCYDLYEALEKERIKAFLDEKSMEKGSTIDSEIIRSIQESRFSIIILSENFAFSSYCLDELFAIYQLTQRKAHRALPIFLKVKTDDVYQLTGKIGEAFKHHESRVGGMEIIKQTVRIFEWKTAMHSVAGMVGWVYPDRNNYRSRTQLIGKIVKDMLGYLQRPSPNVGVQLVLSNTALKEMNLYLCEQLEDMDIIWICGPAGMSNNTIARFIYGVMAKSGIEAIASRISTWTATTIDPTRELMDVTQGRLQHKNVLVMVDDIYRLEELVHLAILQNVLTPESRVIVSKDDPANKNMVHVQSLSFEGPKRNWHRKALDISLFKQNIIDHEMGILRSLVSGGFACQY
ncbi:hypothetical protein Tsubulata_033536 [Turnera subulata]|uniref:TIR domain-containing protein n=1 Tax=Turnera subulata TaxID=218843 RepID=A0A9Q0FWX5_9ROSI|nr:hypothetical protein Tsubulata_033536 [Turnera subulata]